MLDKSFTGPTVAALVADYRSRANEQREYAEAARRRVDEETQYAACHDQKAAQFDAFADRLATLELNQD